jgi:hypothetical protein
MLYAGTGFRVQDFIHNGGGGGVETLKIDRGNLFV